MLCLLSPLILVLVLPENEDGIFDAVLRGHIDFASDPWPSISNSAKDLVKKMLRQDPKERLTAAEILSKYQTRPLPLPSIANPGSIDWGAPIMQSALLIHLLLCKSFSALFAN